MLGRRPDLADHVARRDVPQLHRLIRPASRDRFFIGRKNERCDVSRARFAGSLGIDLSRFDVFREVPHANPSVERGPRDCSSLARERQALRPIQRQPGLSNLLAAGQLLDSQNRTHGLAIDILPSEKASARSECQSAVGRLLKIARVMRIDAIRHRLLFEVPHRDAVIRVGHDQACGAVAKLDVGDVGSLGVLEAVQKFPRVRFPDKNGLAQAGRDELTAVKSATRKVGAMSSPAPRPVLQARSARRVL